MTASGPGNPDLREKLREFLVFARNFLVDGLCAVLPRPRQPQDRKPSVLLVRLDAIGDFILWQDSLKELRAIYPAGQYRVTLLANALWSELAEKLPFFDEVIPVDRKSLYYDLGYRVRTWRTLRRRGWQVAIEATHSREFLWGDAAVRVCGARERIGSRGDRCNQSALRQCFSDRWYTRLIPASTALQMELERNADFIRGLGRTGFRAGLPELQLNGELPKGFTARGYFVIVPGASVPQRQWPREKFAELARRINCATGLKVVICGSAGERSLGSYLIEVLGDAAEDWTGRTSLAQFACLIREARFLIGNESSAIHIAAAVGVQAFSLTGGGHFGRFVPYRLERDTALPLPVPLSHGMDCFGCSWHCIYPVPDGACAPCLAGIALEKAWEAVQKVVQLAPSSDGNNRPMIMPLAPSTDGNTGR